MNCLDDDDEFCKLLQSGLLAIWRKDHNISLIAYEFSKVSIEHKLEKFKRQMIENEQISMGLQVVGSAKKSKN